MPKFESQFTGAEIEERLGKIPQMEEDIEDLKLNGGGGGNGGIITETDPTVPAWAKAATKPSYNKSEVGLGNVDNVKQYSASNPPPYPVTSVNGQTGAVNVSVPTKTSELTNNSGFITKAVTDLANYYTKSDSYTKSEVNSLISAIPKFAISVVSSLPTSEISGTTIYLVNGGETNDLYTEYIYVNSKWEILGAQRVDLTGYATESWVGTQIESKVNVSDIVNNLATNASNKPLSAEQGVALKGLIDNLAVIHYDKAQNLSEAQKKQARKNVDVPANAEIFENTSNPLFTNIFDSVELQYGKLLNSDGSVTDTAAPLVTSNNIPITQNGVVRMKNIALLASTSQTSPCVNLYNASGGLIAHIKANAIESSTYYFSDVGRDESGNINEFKVIQTKSLAYIKICTTSDCVGTNPILTVNEEINYEMGYGSKLNPNVKVEYSQVINSPKNNAWSILPYEHLNICYSSINRKPINTIEHFTDAAENFGYNALKCDVRPTADGELVCCHDAGFTFDGNGYITTYDSNNQTKIHDVTAATCLGYSFPTGEHPCLVGDYLDVCRKYKKVAFVTIRNEYMDVVIPKLLEELKAHNMTYATIINCMTYESLVQWRAQDSNVMINYTLNYGVAIDQTQIDRAVSLGYCSLCGFSLSSTSTTPSASCDFEYARANGIRLLEAIAYKEGSPEACYDMGYDGCQIGIPWGTANNGISEEEVTSMIEEAIGGAIGGAY
ncbi:MAG: hypothetical protein J6Q10_03745 [Clostridia bacterium]|nr:hypothetical protein [Clostridia bacterium]